MPLSSRKNSPLALIKRTLKPNLVQIINVTGTLFRVKEAKKVFYVSLDDDAEFPIEAGLGVQMQEPDFFKSVSVINKNAEDLDIEIWVGNNNVIDNRLNTRFDRNNPVFTKDAPTVIAGGAPTVMAPNDVLIIPERSLGVHRKQIVITNVSGGSRLAILAGQGGPEVASIAATLQFTIFTSSEVVIKCIGGASNTVDVLETWYT